jgi:hypothetical protein
MQFDADDLQQLYAFAADRPTIQRFPMAPECPLTATEGDETAAAGRWDSPEFSGLSVIQ